MTLTDLLRRCREAGVTLSRDAGRRIRYSAPRGMPPDLKAELKANKAALLQSLGDGPTDRLDQRLAQMFRDPATGCLVHPEWFVVPPCVRAELDGTDGDANPPAR